MANNICKNCIYYKELSNKQGTEKIDICEMNIEFKNCKTWNVRKDSCSKFKKKKY